MKRTMNLANEKMAVTSQKLEGLVFRLQHRNKDLEKDQLRMHWELNNKKLIEHWGKENA